MKRSTLIVIVVFGLSGCDNAKQVAIKSVQNLSIETPMTLVINPGFKVKLGGEAVPISGSQDCFVANKDVVNIGAAADDRRTCIVIKPQTKTVPVLVELPDGPIHENWNVVRSGDSTLLQRTDGSYVEYVN